MSKQTETQETRPAGRPSTFPDGTELVPASMKIPAEARNMLREMSQGRKNQYGLEHNSMGAEFARIVEQAYRRFSKSQEKSEG